MFSQFSEFITPAIFSANEDATQFEGFDNAPRIMYNNGIKTLDITYYIPPQNTLASENQTQFLQFSHLSDISTISGTRDFHFGENIAVVINSENCENKGFSIVEIFILENVN